MAYALPIIAMNMKTARLIGDVFGGLLELDEDQIMMSAKFLRLRVMVDTSKPLRRGIILSFGKKKVWVEFKYERLSNCCYFYGYFCPVERDCEADSDDREEQLYGDSLRASPLRRNVERDLLEKKRFKMMRQGTKNSGKDHDEIRFY